MPPMLKELVLRIAAGRLCVDVPLPRGYHGNCIVAGSRQGTSYGVQSAPAVSEVNSLLNNDHGIPVGGNVSRQDVATLQTISTSVLLGQSRLRSTAKSLDQTTNKNTSTPSSLHTSSQSADHSISTAGDSTQSTEKLFYPSSRSPIYPVCNNSWSILPGRKPVSHHVSFPRTLNTRCATMGVMLQPRRSVSYLSDPENTGEQTSGVNFDTLGSWNNRLKLKIDVTESIRLGTIVPQIALSAVGQNTLLGRRATNEDRIIVTELRPNLLLFGMLDGHGGSLAVDHVSEHLPKYVMACLERGEDNLTEVLRKSFIDVNNSFTKLYLQQRSTVEEVEPTPEQGNRRKPTPISSGTTATVCLIRNGVELIVAHVGDSRAILCRNNTAVRLTIDHLPSLQAEASRIIRCKGHLSWSSLGRSRVNGRLEMTRSIGDVELKQYGVIADPDVTTVQIKNGSDSFLALTTDGIHNRLNSSEIVQLIASCDDPHEAAEFLTDQALLFGSEDNCSILVIPFGAWGKFSETFRQVHFTRNRNPGIGWSS